MQILHCMQMILLFATPIKMPLLYRIPSITTWLEMNHLTLNAKKSKFMMIVSKQKMESLELVTITLGNTDLQSSNTFKYLGVTINCQLMWDEHVYSISSSISKKLSLPPALCKEIVLLL